MDHMQISRRQHGFTLIEVMIVVAIIGILAAIIMPGIRDYAIRAKMSEVMLAFQNCRQAISEGYQVMEASPGPDNWGCEDSTKSPYILTVNTTGTGIIKISVQGFNDLRIDTHDITMAPVDFQGNFGTVGETRIAQWRCGAPRDGTTMRPNYLPANCKG